MPLRSSSQCFVEETSQTSSDPCWALGGAPSTVEEIEADLRGLGCRDPSPPSLLPDKERRRLAASASRGLKPSDGLVSRILRGEKSYWEALDEFRTLAASSAAENEALRLKLARATSVFQQREASARRQQRALQEERAEQLRSQKELIEALQTEVKRLQSEASECASAKAKVAQLHLLLKQQRREADLKASELLTKVRHHEATAAELEERNKAVQGLNEKVSALQRQLAKAVSSKNLLLQRVKLEVGEVSAAAADAREALQLRLEEQTQRAEAAERAAAAQKELQLKKLRDVQAAAAAEASQFEFTTKRVGELEKTAAKLRAQLESVSEQARREAGQKESKLEALQQQLLTAGSQRDRANSELAALRASVNGLKEATRKAEREKDALHKELLQSQVSHAGLQREAAFVSEETGTPAAGVCGCESCGFSDPSQRTLAESCETRGSRCSSPDGTR